MEQALYELRVEFWKKTYENWIAKEFLSPQWFFLIALLLVFYFTWIKLVDKSRLRELLLFGSFMAVTSTFIDIVAVTMVIWRYKIRLLPISPAPFPFDFTIIPILYMFIKQYTNTWRNYLIGSALASSAFAFIIQPIFVYIGIKELYKFNHLYTFLLLFAVTTIVKFIFDWVTNLEQRKCPNNSKP